MRLFLIVTGILGLTSPAAAFAVVAPANCADFEILDRGVTREYNPFRPTNLVDTFTLRATRLNPAVTSVRFLLVDKTTLNGNPQFGQDGPALYTVNWVDDPARNVFVTGAEPISTLNAARIGFAGRQDIGQTNFQLKIERGQTALAGRQYEQLVVRYQCYIGSDRLGDQVESFDGKTELAITIPRIVSAYVGSSGQDRGEIAFGTLSGAGAGDLRRSASVSTMSTLPYAIDISSENGRKLRRGPSETGEIDYQLKVAGQVIETDVTVRCPVTPMPAGESKIVEVTLDGASIRSQPAGDYRDVITLTFRPAEGYSGNACRTANAR